MALPVRAQATYWGLAAAAAVLVLWLLGDVILPFVLGGAVAYVLDPIADRLERWGMSRVWATVTITLLAILIFVVTILLIVPTLIRQAEQLIDIAPVLLQRLQAWLTETFPDIVIEDSPARQQLAAIGEAVQSRAAVLLNSVLSSAVSFFNVIFVLVVVPVVAFYLLLDWDRMVAEIDDLLPREHAPTIRRLAREIDATLAGFIRGQGTVMLIQGIYYAAALMIAGLQFGLIVGAVAGLISFIPYVGAIVGGALAIGLALFQFWGDWLMIVVVAAIFASGQVLEGNVLTPKLVGGSVGLHPVWLLFALAVFGALFGFVGLLVAVPVAAMIGVVARFALARYKLSLLYRGVSGGK